jgi:hypothetical protein
MYPTGVISKIHDSYRVAVAANIHQGKQNRNHCPAVIKKKNHNPHTKTEGNQPTGLYLLPTNLLKLPLGDPQLLFHQPTPSPSPSPSPSHSLTLFQLFPLPPDAEPSPEF